MIAKRSGAENFQDSKSANEIQNGIKQGYINKFRALTDGSYSLYCAVTANQVDAKTRSKVGINELLRGI